MEKIGRRLKGRVAIVTASRRGLVLSIAERLGLEGASVVISSRKQTMLTRQLRNLELEESSVGGRLSCIPCTTEEESHREDCSAPPQGVTVVENWQELELTKIRSPPIRVTSDKMMPAAKHHIEEHPNREQGHRRHNSQQINILDQQKSRNHKSTRSESGSDKSSSDHSLLQKNHRRARSEQNKNLGEGSNSFSPSVPHQPSRLRSGTGNHPSDNIPQRAASVPKFGAWDETDPKSGEGFTIIFNKVKEEKQIGAANFPTVPPQTNIYQNSHGSSSSEPKMEKIGRRFEGKVAIVTASTQGIGFSIAERLGLEGASVVISSRKQNNVNEAVEKLRARGIQVLGVVCCVSHAQQRKNLIEKTAQKYGKIDVIVSNAAANPSVDAILETQESVLDKLREIKIKASVLLLKALASEMGPDTRVNCVAPGFVPTNFASFITKNEAVVSLVSLVFPLEVLVHNSLPHIEYECVFVQKKAIEKRTLLNRLGTTEDMAAAAAFLASDDASYITGETLVVAGGIPSRL
ncbi:hypothetical protein HHK36_032163 [Tetracentron sinense]|uniref:RIN4 pathogenic type III effector avirulence factor Avr cleavage site domain-containing protein n=1 Tax=Tetracentron sinense TaxID=13715 RepID=A0A834Y7S5_TETSI|nr:hypothetical protein HHK36_032163 [Tetracentron sinense]